MYNCLKFFEKIFISLKNFIINVKIKNILPKKYILKYIKELYLNKKKINNLNYSDIKKKYIISKIKFFFLKFKNV